jgi:chromosome segregation ATPase
MTSTDEALAGACRELEDVKARRAAASSTMMSASSDPDAFARARAERDRLAAECERLELHIGSLEERRQQEQEDARAERRRRLEEEASSLNEQIMGLAVAGLDLTLRLGAILHEVERLRWSVLADGGLRGVTIGTWMAPRGRPR